MFWSANKCLFKIWTYQNIKILGQNSKKTIYASEQLKDSFCSSYLQNSSLSVTYSFDTEHVTQVIHSLARCSRVKRYLRE